MMPSNSDSNKGILLDLAPRQENHDEDSPPNSRFDEPPANKVATSEGGGPISPSELTMTIPRSPKQKRVGVGVKKSVLFWAVTFLVMIFLSLSDALSPRGENNNGARRRVRGTIRGQISSSPSTPTTIFDLEESKRLLRLESASPISYLYRYRAPRTIAPPSSNPPTQPTPLEEDHHPSSSSPIFTSFRSQPRVFLRSNGQSGVIQRRISAPAEIPTTTSTTTTTTTPTTTTTTTKNFPSSSSSEEEISNEKSDKVFESQNVVEDDQNHDYYPYHYYLDFDDKSKSPPPQKSEYLHPQPSEHLKPYALPDTQSSLWNEFLQHHTQTNGDDSSVQTPTYIPPPVHLNEINTDNYTIPALRDYRFPDFKSITTTTIKPPKHNFLNPYEFFSEEDLENVADLDFDSDHSKYFVKTKPRDVSSSVANLYNSFYYEPPSYSTKSQPLPVKAVTFPQEKQFKWTRVENSNDLDNFNYFDGSSLVTFPMSTGTTTTSTITTSTGTPDFLNFPATSTASSATRNESEYAYFSPPEKSPSDVATAESIAILAASKASSNINLIPDDDTFVHKDGKILADVTTVATTTTTPKMDLYMPPSTTPSSGSDKDTTNIPGMPGVDYPIFDEIPVTGFDCAKQRYKGFFADIESKCQVWHYCDFADGHSSFLCPNGTLFSQVLLTCDWWFNVDCIQAQQLYVLNERLYRYIKPPKPSFPEDYHGPGVDLWLKKQLELGLLPKIKKGRKQQLEKPVPTTLKEKVEEDTSPPSTTTPTVTITTTTTTTPEPSSSFSLEDEKNE